MALVLFPSSSGVMLNYLQLISRLEAKFMGDKMFYPSLRPSCSYCLLLLHALRLCLCPGIAPAGPAAAGGQVAAHPALPLSSSGASRPWAPQLLTGAIDLVRVTSVTSESNFTCD